jgi:hypothetical protein
MKLSFSNPSRNYDVTRDSVRFSGYINITEVEFFVEAGALKKLSPTMDSAESGYLQSFDTARERIYAVADKAYVKGRNGSTVYVLKTGDF